MLTFYHKFLNYPTFFRKLFLSSVILFFKRYKSSTFHGIATITLYFVRSGSINIGMGYSWYAGLNSNYWSCFTSSEHRTGSTVPSAYYLEFDVSGTRPSNGPSFRWYSLPLRCLNQFELLPKNKVQLTFFSVISCKILTNKSYFAKHLTELPHALPIDPEG